MGADIGVRFKYDTKSTIKNDNIVHPDQNVDINCNHGVDNNNDSTISEISDNDDIIHVNNSADNNKIHDFDSKSLNIVNINIVTLPGKLDELRSFLGSHPIDIMGLAETRLDDVIPDNDVEIDNYTLYRKDRNRNGGGVAAYVNRSSGLVAKIRYDLMPDELELLALEIKHTNSKPIIMLFWYRTPSSVMHCFTYIENVLQMVEKENKDIILIGDVNCDILNPCCYTKKLLEITENYHLHQIITDPTRITENTFTLIDHVYTSNVDKITSSGVLHTGVSDHSLIYASWGKSIKTRNHVHNYKVNRKYKNFNADEFDKDLQSVQWCQVTEMKDVNDALSKFESLFLPICNKHAPLRRRRVRKQKSPWITNDIVNMMRERDKIKKKAISSSSPQIWKSYRAIRNKVNSTIRQSKKSFLTDRICSSKNDSKVIWNTLRHVVPGKSKNENITCLKSQDGEHSDAKSIANIFNKHFANVGPKLASTIPNMTSNTPTSNVKRTDNDCEVPNDMNEDNFILKPVNEDLVFKSLQSLSDGKATGTDDLPAKLLKMASMSIVGPITHIINLSITTNVFPHQWKSARICPIFKKGDCTDPNNYRPISVLPVISKLLERIVFDQLYPFLNSKDLLHDTQSGFRPNHSTCTALINITEDWYNCIDNGEYVGIVMLDLKKAFDTVNHEILIDKLSDFNLSQDCITWFSSYLSGRTHITCIKGVKSEPTICICGIPQGSILGPLLFIMYINDLPNCVSNVNVSMYADDTGLYESSKQIDTLVDKLNQDLSRVDEWLIKNKLSLNVPKCEVMIMGTRQRLSKIDNVDVNVNINGIKLQRVDKCKHLGVTFNKNLTWQDQVDEVRKKALVGIYMLRKTKNLIPSHTQSMLYKSIIAPHFDYCNIVWGTCGTIEHNKLQILQNRSAKIITGAGYYDSATEALTQLKWNPLVDRCKYHESLAMYKIMNDLTPTYLRNRFELKDTRYELRGYKSLVIPKPNTEYKKRSLSYRGAKSWNNMDINLKQARNVGHFKRIFNM